MMSRHAHAAIVPRVCISTQVSVFGAQVLHVMGKMESETKVPVPGAINALQDTTVKSVIHTYTRWGEGGGVCRERPPGEQLLQQRGVCGTDHTTVSKDIDKFL